MCTSIEALTKGMPPEFEQYLSYCRSLKFDEKPDIQYLRKLYKDLFYKMGYDYDFVFDWMVKKPQSVTNQPSTSNLENQVVNGENEFNQVGIPNNSTQANGKQQEDENDKNK